MTNSVLHNLWHIKPINELEVVILTQPEIQQGLSWSKPSYGHPELTVGVHVKDVLRNIEALPIPKADKIRLRLVAMTHDSFKYQEYMYQTRRHGVLARNFMERYTDDLVLLELLEWHDEAYHAWKIGFCHNNFILSEKRIQKVIEKFDRNMDFYLKFFISDTMTGDKNPQPIQWIKRKIKEYQP